MNIFGDLPWTGFEKGTSCSQSDTLPLIQRCSEETDEFSLQYQKENLFNEAQTCTFLKNNIFERIGIIIIFPFHVTPLQTMAYWFVFSKFD